MGRQKKTKADQEQTTQELRPAITPEAQEARMISLAMTQAENELRKGTASSQVVIHYLKLAATKEKQWAVAPETGVRVAEIPPLRWSDITDKGIHIHRQQRMTRIKGKGRTFEELLYTKNERRHPKGGRFFQSRIRSKRFWTR